MTVRLSEQDAWRALSGRVAMQQFPLLPWPELPQDVAYVAFVIDGLRAAVIAQDLQLRRVVLDLWANISRADVARLDEETRVLCRAVHEQDAHGWRSS